MRLKYRIEKSLAYWHTTGILIREWEGGGWILGNRCCHGLRKLVNVRYTYYPAITQLCNLKFSAWWWSMGFTNVYVRRVTENISLNNLVCGRPSVNQHTLKSELGSYVYFSCLFVLVHWRRSMDRNVQINILYFFSRYISIGQDSRNPPSWDWQCLIVS